MTGTPLEVDVLVLAAYAPELAGLRQRLGERLHATIGELQVVAKTVGIGMAVAGAGTATRLSLFPPRAVVLLGSCGAYPSGGPPPLLRTVIPGGSRLIDPAVRAGSAAFPDPMDTVTDCHPGLRAGIAQATGNDLANPVGTTLAITTSDEAARELAAGGLETENLEMFAVGQACQVVDVPFAAVLSITNEVGSCGRQQWQDNHRKAAIQAANALIAWLDRGAPGLPAREEGLIT